MTITDEMIYACAAEARTIWLATLPVKGDLPVRQTSLAFSRRMERLLRQQRMTAQEAKRHAWRRVAVAALIAAAALLAAAWTIKTNWAQIVKIVRRVFPEWTEYQYSSGTEAGILPDVAFGYLPDGEIGDEQETPGEYQRQYTVVYADGRYIDLFQVLMTQQSGHGTVTDTEGAAVSECVVRGSAATVIEKNGVCQILWAEENVLYHLYGEGIPVDQLKEVAERLKISEGD